MRRETLILAAVILAGLTGPASAYVGPGLGLGAVAAVFGVLAAIFFTIIALVWYPMKRAWRRVSAGRTASAPQGDSADRD